jgi:hypothetical protein
MSWQALISSSLQGEIDTLKCSGLMLGLLRIAGIMKCSTGFLSHHALNKFEVIDFVSNSGQLHLTPSLKAQERFPVIGEAVSGFSAAA